MEDLDRRIRSGEEISLTFEGFRPHLDEKGEFKSNYNNFWLNVIIAPKEAESSERAQFKAIKFAKKISNLAEREKFLTLCKQYTTMMYPVIRDVEKRTQLRLKDECNNVLWEIYKIAVNNKIASQKLFQ